MKYAIILLVAMGICESGLAPAFAGSDDLGLGKPVGLSVDEQADAIVASMKSGERKEFSLCIEHQPLDKEIRRLEAARQQAWDKGDGDRASFIERKLNRRLELQAAEEASPGAEGTSDRCGALFTSAQEEFADEEQYYRSIGREDLARKSAEKLHRVQVSEAVSVRWKDEIERLGAEREAGIGESSAAKSERLDEMARQGAGLIPWPVREPATIFRPGAAGSSSRARSPLSGNVFRPGATAAPTPAPTAFRRETTVTRSGGVTGSKLSRPSPRPAPTLPSSSFGKRDFRGYTFGGSSPSSSRTFRPRR